MKKYFLFILTAGVLCILPQATHASDLNVLYQQITQLQKTIQQLTTKRQADLTRVMEKEWNTYKKNKPNFKGGLAMQVLSPKGDYFVSTGLGKEASNASHFRTASVSKTFTAAAIMLLNQRGLLNIDDKITDNIPGTGTPYLPNTPEYDVPNKGEITIKMLLMHWAGVFDVSNNPIPDNQFSHEKPYVGQSYISYMEKIDPQHTFTFDELVGVVARNKLSFFKPGLAYHYSDTGYSMLGKIIERVSNKTYANFIKDELLAPNGLNDTVVVTDGADQEMMDPHPKSYYWDGKESFDVTLSNMSPHVAEGSMTTTARDLANWANKLFTGQAGLSKETINQMINACTKTGVEGSAGDYEYGLGILCTKLGYGHNGAHEAFLSNMIYNPKTGVAYAIYTNSWNCQSCSKNIDSLKDELKEMDLVSNKVLKKLGY